MKKKLLSVLMVLTLLASSTGALFANSVQASAAVPTQSNTILSETTTTHPEQTEPTMSTQGFKGFLAKTALQLVRVAVDKGGDVLAYVTKWLDKDAAKYITNNKSKIANSIKKVENWLDEASDVTQTTIKNRLNKELRDAGVPTKYSLQIADAVARTVTWLLL